MSEANTSLKLGQDYFWYIISTELLKYIGSVRNDKPINSYLNHKMLI